MKMIPPTFPPKSDRSFSRGEELLFQWLKSSKVKGTCFHSLRLKRHPDPRKPSSEADFVILTDNGIMVLEVKGGLVWRGHDGTWRQKGADDGEDGHKLRKSPFVQAEEAMHGLRESLIANGFRKLVKPTTFGWGTSFPQCSFDNKSSPEWEDWQVHDNVYKGEKVDTWIRNFQKEGMRKWGGKPLSKGEFEALEAAIRPAFSSTITLSSISEEVQQQIRDMTDDQILTVAAAEKLQRLVYTGGAGTGKTVIALEIARQHAANDEHVVVMTPSEVLTKFLCSQPETEGISFVTIRERKETEEYADVLIVDEAQDFLDWEGLSISETWLENGLENGKWRFLYDPNLQAAIHGRFNDECDELLRQYADLAHHFVKNCRNTKSIVEAVSDYTAGDIGAPSITKGDLPEIEIAESQEEAAKLLKRHLLKLLNSNIPPESITILSPSPESSCVALPAMDNLSGAITRFTSEMANPSNRNGITLATPQEFKGLESQFVCFIDVEGFSTSKHIAELYVSMTRTLVGFWMVIDKSIESAFQENFMKNLEQTQQVEK